ncbi:gamma carbonic anhydrase family protein [Fusibacter ferrireducens]|uniref:Gamma carbonic anhydrase family protein n=1 Tax=Fusibacter ferrireducens TaxID=2785058 RepID=A0ABR9ZR18_9FIRM|nr:gamma carbonic anhydrase family protein [Fusibacter ferrireducens]MBF4692897.1 gamma carbonic anhydrase family protein [Fusibacter ferrireducens]
MKIPFKNQFPECHEKSYVAEGAKVIGQVNLGLFSSIWFNTVVRGDINTVKIGKYSNIQDNSVVHVGDHNPTLIGDYVTVGHNAVIHGCTIEDHCLVGMSATILNGAVIGEGSIIAAGALVKENTIIPPFSLVVGVPGKIVKSLPKDTRSIHAQAVKYKTLWTEHYAFLKDAGGEVYNGEKII